MKVILLINKRSNEGTIKIGNVIVYRGFLSIPAITATVVALGYSIEIQEE
jgi:hypothetical protein